MLTVCPIALAVGCKKCALFCVCPLRSVIGDYRKPDDAPPNTPDANPAPKQDPRA